MKFNIYGDNWEFHVMDTDNFVKEFGEELGAFVVPSTREAFFSEDDLNEEIVVHEVTHIYIYNMCLNSANIQQDQLEEIFCDMMATHGRKILRQARKIYKEMKD